METVKIPLSKLEFSEQYCFTERGEKYYLAYEKEPYISKSILWANLDFVIKNLSDNGVITSESLNEGRKNQIRDYELCLKHNCSRLELDKIDRESGELKTYVNENKETVTYQIQYHLVNPYHLKNFPLENHFMKKDIEKGLYVLCEIVDDTPTYDI